MLAVAAAAVFAGCGSGGTKSVGVEFTRADGSLVTFPQTVRAWCGPYDDDNATPYDDDNATPKPSTFSRVRFRARSPRTRSGS